MAAVVATSCEANAHHREGCAAHARTCTRNHVRYDRLQVVREDHTALGELLAIQRDLDDRDPSRTGRRDATQLVVLTHIRGVHFDCVAHGCRSVLVAAARFAIHLAAARAEVAHVTAVAAAS